MNDQLLFAGMWIVFFVFHSFLASSRLKRILQAKLLPFKYYRIGYNVFSIVSLLPVFVVYRKIEKTQLFESSYWNQAVGVLLIIISLFLWKLTFRNYSLAEFVGTDRLTKNYIQKPEFKKNGLNALVRHPLYSVSLILLTGFFLLYPNDLILISVVLIFSYFPVGIYFEELKMIRYFGKEYLEYKKKTPKLIPRFYKRLKLNRT
jgi:protein-S-isoprenylcysteine O-methyltransferase Ste14